MKTLKNFISESNINEAERASIKDYVLWHYELDDIKDFSYDRFASKSFDDAALKKYFNGDKKAMYDEMLSLMKADKQASIDAQYYRFDDNFTQHKIKISGKTFNALHNERWYAAQDNTHYGNDDSKLTYNEQLDFTAYLRDRLEKEGWLAKLNISTRSRDYRFGGLVYFDHVHGVCSKDDRNIKDLTADGSLTYAEAYEIALSHLKKVYK